MLLAKATIIASLGAGWQALVGRLLASGVMLLSGHQDIRLGSRMGAGFWLFMALAFDISALAAAISMKIWCGALVCVVVLCFETWLILRSWNRTTPP